MSKKRVVITGIGVISPVGTGLPKFWEALKKGESGIRNITHFDASEFTCNVNGDVIDYDPLEHFNSKEARNLARFVQFASVASKEAIQQAQLNFDNVERERVGVLIGSGIGAIQNVEEEYQRYMDRGARKMSPHFIPKIIINEAAGQVAIEHGLKGPATCVATACSTATNAIGDAYRFLQYDDADIMIAGGTESATTILGLGGFCALKALTQRNNDPQGASRPFDGERDGFVMAEGAGIMVLETLDHAKKRNAPIIAELAGYGRTCDAYHITAPESTGAGAAKAMELAIKDAGCAPTDISYINAHGTSTKLNDKVETLAIKKTFGDYAAKVPISSTKSMTGHLLGAAGGVELAACIMGIVDNVAPPTINQTTPDPDCDLDYIPNQAREVKIDYAMSNSLGFGGHNASVVVKRFEE